MSGRRAFALALLVAGSAVPAAGQEVAESARQASTEWARIVAFLSEPREPEFADVFELMLTVRVAPGLVAFLPDTLLPARSSVSAGPGRWETTPGPADSLDVRATYPVMAFVPGGVELPDLEIFTRPANGGEEPGVRAQSELADDVDRVGLDRSVLYAGGVLIMPPSDFVGDNAGLMPRAPADVLGGERSGWWIAALLVIAGGAIYVAWLLFTLLAGGTASDPIALAASPHEEALEELDRILAQGWHKNGRVARFYEATTDVLRRFSRTEDEAWSTALTSSELMAELERRWTPATVDELRAAVWSAERAKFSELRPQPDTAEHDWTVVRSWIARRGDG